MINTSEQNITLLTLELFTDNQDDRPIFIAGNFNGWQEQNDHYTMNKVKDGHYQFVFENIDQLPETIEYKYTRGGWQNSEADNLGSKTSNRTISKHQKVITDYVPRWFNEGKSFTPANLPIIEVVNEAFEIPQLDKTRRIQILLPNDYHDSTRHYPVLYLQDGQNLFDWNAPFGNWAINEKLAILKEYNKGDVIIVAIDHGEVSRINEFTPRNEIKLGIGQGEGAKYLEFMSQTLKPYIDEHYRTQTQREYTGIGGSSMGGLISLFGGILQAKTFGKVMVFSPSLWIYPDVYEEVKTSGSLANTHLYIYAGGRESKGMLPKVHQLLTNIHESNQNTKVNLVVDPNGTHSESCWSNAFPEAVEWLFFS